MAYVRHLILLMMAIGACVLGEAEDDEDEDFPKPRSRCPWIRNALQNGRVKLRSRGRIAKFVCNPGYDLVGKRFSTCVRSHWNNPVPVCVRQGCSNQGAPDNGKVTEMYMGAVVVYACNPGYRLLGSPSLFCNGYHWNGTAPTCEMSTKNPSLSCDFEFADLCGWTHDPSHDFDWKRHQFGTPSGHVGTGPSYDHTFGKGMAGYYLYVEASSPRKENDTARLFSPVYPPEQSPGCFTFWYHMFGATTGSLSVYLKGESQVLAELQPVWIRLGEQGNHWLYGTVPISATKENFQIVIEGIRGSSYVGDMAIDDISLQRDCGSTQVQQPVLSDNSTTMAMPSCQGRCDIQEDEVLCACHTECQTEKSCCPDYWYVCLPVNSSRTEEGATGTDVESEWSSIDSDVATSPISLASETASATENHRIVTSSQEQTSHLTTTQSTSTLLPTTITDLPSSIYQTYKAQSTVSSSGTTVQFTEESRNSTAQTLSPTRSETEGTKNTSSPTSSTLTIKPTVSTTFLLVETTQSPNELTTQAATETPTVITTQSSTQAPVVVTTRSSTQTPIALTLFNPAKPTLLIPSSTLIPSRTYIPILAIVTSKKTVQVSVTTPQEVSTSNTGITGKSTTVLPYYMTQTSPTRTSGPENMTTSSSPSPPRSAMPTRTHVSPSVRSSIARKPYARDTTPTQLFYVSNNFIYQRTASWTPSTSTSRSIPRTTPRRSTTVTSGSSPSSTRKFPPALLTSTMSNEIPVLSDHTESTWRNSASTSARSSSHGSAGLAAGLSIGVVGTLLLTSLLVYTAVRRRKVKQNKLSDDSEMRFLPDSEVFDSMNVGDPSA